MLTIGYALEVMSSDRLKNSMDLPLGRRDGLMWLKWHSSFRRCSGDRHGSWSHSKETYTTTLARAGITYGYALIIMEALFHYLTISDKPTRTANFPSLACVAGPESPTASHLIFHLGG